jgi:ribonucleotide reductase beta subunit family protein with ferritin-like domain
MLDTLAKPQVLPRIMTRKDTYTVDYPQAISFAEEQASIFWTPEEVDVEKDLHDIKTNFTHAEYHGIVSTLKLFTLYELRVGQDYWLNYVCKVFPRPDIQRMATTFGFFEIGVHAPFYDKINVVLGLSSDEFYTAYLEDPILEARIKWIESRCAKKGTIEEVLTSVGSFSMVEGAVLYSNFAFLKHFNNAGKNKLTAVNSGVDFSALDETIHSRGGAWLFRQTAEEANIDMTKIRKDLEQTARVIAEHEDIIIGKIFEYGPIEGITPLMLTAFVEHRLDMCLINLGFEAIFHPTNTSIQGWFYNDLNSSILHDFFVSQGSDYNRAWDKSKFAWNVTPE